MDLREAHLEGANLSGAHLQHANLWRAHLTYANLSGAHVEGAYLSEAQLKSASLREAHFQGAFLEGAHLENANLRKTRLEGLTLSGTHLQGANLSEALLKRTLLIGAHLEGADLSQATGLKQGQLEKAFGDDLTILPEEGPRRPAHWPPAANAQKLRRSRMTAAVQFASIHAFKLDWNRRSTSIVMRIPVQSERRFRLGLNGRRLAVGDFINR